MDFLNQMAENAPKPEEAEVKVDLSGMEKPDALQKLDSIVAYCKKSAARTLYVTFDAAKPGGGETLFQPVARYFKMEKFNGYITHAIPVMKQDSGGLFVTFKV
jgi:hypothetical protein